MEFARRRIFYQKQDLQLAWEGIPNPSRFFSLLRSHAHPPREALSEAGHFLGGALISDGFRIFKNGGLPLLERRSGALIEEIVLRSSPFVCDEPFLPIRVYLHLSNSKLQDVRLRYWRPASRAPSCLSCLDLGELELPPCWVIWNVGTDYQVLVELLDWVKRLALPWFDLFEDPHELRTQIYRGMVAGLDPDRSLEILLAEFGPVEALRYLHDCVMPDNKMGPQVREATKRIHSASAVGGIGRDKSGRGSIATTTAPNGDKDQSRNRIFQNVLHRALLCRHGHPL